MSNFLCSNATLCLIATELEKQTSVAFSKSPARKIFQELVYLNELSARESGESYEYFCKNATNILEIVAACKCYLYQTMWAGDTDNGYINIPAEDLWKQVELLAHQKAYEFCNKAAGWDKACTDYWK